MLELVIQNKQEMRVTEHISRKELKQDKIRDSFAHALKRFTHTANCGLLVAIVLAAVLGYAGWKFYTDARPCRLVAFDEANKVYSADRRHNASADPTTFLFRPSKRDPRRRC